MTERTAWNDTRLDAEFVRVYKQINGTPERMARVEEALKTLGHQVQDLVEENEALRAEIRGAEWSRSQIIGAFGVLVAFLAAVGSVLVGIFA